MRTASCEWSRKVKLEAIKPMKIYASMHMHAFINLHVLEHMHALNYYITEDKRINL